MRLARLSVDTLYTPGEGVCHRGDESTADRKCLQAAGTDRRTE